jgi:hypothetical protein
VKNLSRALRAKKSRAEPGTLEFDLLAKLARRTENFSRERLLILRRPLPSLLFLPELLSRRPGAAFCLFFFSSEPMNSRIASSAPSPMRHPVRMIRV